jgi:hypothetical protein
VCSAKNSCFGPGLRNDESGRTYLFTNVLMGGGVISGYTQNFVKGTTAAEAEQAVMEWMPKDATMSAITVDTDGGSCGLATITSPTLAKELGNPKVGDPSGVVGVDFEYIDANLNVVYNPNNVEDASLQPLPFSSTDSC